MRIKKTNNRGDTIIEVLICLAILGFIMSITYSIVSRAQKTIRSSQERVEALKLAEGQLERLKGSQRDSTLGSLASKPSSSPFCYGTDGSVTGFSVPNPNNWSADINSDQLSTYPPGCKGQGSGNLYNVSIVAPNNAQGGLFTVRVRWERLGGGQLEEVKLEYKIYAN